MNLTDKEISAIKEDSESITSLKTEITNQITILDDFDRNIISGLKTDDIDRKAFLNSVGIINGLATEYRNVYGVEVPLFELSYNNKIQLQDDDNGNKVYTENRTDCTEIINSARLKDSEGNALYTRFFIDDNATETSSNFYLPMCPPGFEKWAGDNIYNGVCREFDLTERELRNFLANGTVDGTSSYPISFDKWSTDGTSTSFNSNNQFEVACDENGNLQYNKWTYDIDDNTLKSYSPIGGASYGADNYSDTSPFKYLGDSLYNKMTERNTVYKYKIVSYSNGRTYGTGYLSIRKDGTKTYANLIKKISGSLTTKKFTRHKIVWNSSGHWWNPFRWFVRKTYTDYNNYHVDLYSVDKNSDEFRKAVLTYYKNILYKALDNYNRVSMSKFDKNTVYSINSMRDLYNKIEDYLNGESSFSSVLKKINTRYVWLYSNINIIVPEHLSSFYANMVWKSSRLQYQKRANQINSHLVDKQTLFAEAFSAINTRVNKREGSLAKVYKTVKAKELTGDTILLKKASCASKQKNMYAFSCTSDGDDSTTAVMISIEDWEDVDTVTNAISRGQSIYLVSDNAVMDYTVVDINKSVVYIEDEDGNKVESTTDITFEVILSKKISSAFKTEDGLRLVKVVN